MADTTEYAWDRDRTTLRFPDPAIQVVDERFRGLIVEHEIVQRLWTGGRWLEGPVWFGDGRFLVFSDIPNNRMLRWDEETGAVTPFRVPSNNSNGNSRDRQGRLISCEHLTRRVTRTEHDGRITVLLNTFDGKRLNAPNDLVAHSDGSIWFTDPGYGVDGWYEGDKADKELPRDVYRIGPDTGEGATGEAAVAITGMNRPNGLCFSPDETLLYVVDVDQIRVFDIVDGRPTNGRVFVATHGWNSDGIRCDQAGNLWAAAGNGGNEIDGVHCYAPDGALLGRILLPEVCANLCFGGIKKNRLFMAASRSLYSVYVEALGDQTP
jgi:gluconolactonase